MIDRPNNSTGFRSFPIAKKDDPKGINASKQDLEDAEKRHEKQMHTLTILLTAVVIVLFVALLSCVFALGSMFLDNWRFHSEAYNNYVETIRVQGLVIEQNNRDRDELLKEIENIKALMNTSAGKK